MSTAALVSLLQAARNQAIAQVQQIEAALELLEADKPPAGPVCRACGAGGLILTRGTAICRECNHNQPA